MILSMATTIYLGRDQLSRRRKKTANGLIDHRDETQARSLVRIVDRGLPAWCLCARGLLTATRQFDRQSGTRTYMYPPLYSRRRIFI